MVKQVPWFDSWQWNTDATRVFLALWTDLNFMLSTQIRLAIESHLGREAIFIIKVELEKESHHQLINAIILNI